MKNILFTKIAHLFLAWALGITLCGGCQQNKSDNKGESQSHVPLVVVSYGGGAYQQSHIDAFSVPFGKNNGINVESVVWGAEYGRLQEMVRSGNVPWDVVEVTAAQFSRGIRDSLFAELTTSVSSDSFKIIEGAATPSNYGVPNVYWSTVLAHKKGLFRDKNPRTWRDFWDINKYPGARAMYDDPRGNLEFALLADGVPLNQLYPLDVDRAFRKLNDIKKDIRLWWKDGTQPVNAIISGTIVLSSAWSGRIFASQQAREAIEYSWAGAAHELDYWVVPRQSKNIDVASRFIVFASSPCPMAKQASATAYGPANALALDHVPQNIRSFLPTDENNWRISFVVNSEWWAANERMLVQRWVSWRNQ